MLLSKLPTNLISSQLQGFAWELLNALLKPRPADIVGQFSTQVLSLLLERQAVQSYSFRQTIAVVMRQDVDEALWRDQLQQEMQYRLGRYQSYRVPTALWPLLMQQAWLDPRFRHNVARLFSAAWHRRVVTPSGQLPVVQLHPHTYALLIALAVASVEQYPSENGRAIKHAATMLQQVSEQLALKATAWAGLWEQWVLWQAYQQWQPARLSDALRATVTVLPVQTLLTDASGPIKGGTAIVAPDWDAMIPDGFVMWMQQYRL